MPGFGGYSAAGGAAIVVAGCLTLLPLVAVGFWGEWIVRQAARLPAWVRVVRPAVLCVPYALVSAAGGMFRWTWLLAYALLPVVVAGLMLDAKRVDPEQRGTWRELLVLAVLGLAVDLRWQERAWPPHLSAFNKMLLLDVGIYGLLVLRELDGVGFDLRLRLRDFGVGAREYLFYAPMAVALGLGMEFLHFHAALAVGAAGGGSGGVYVSLYCDSGGVVLSRVGAESAGAKAGTSAGAAGDGGGVWAGALQ